MDQPKNIIIVGDWVVDEYRTVVQHRSETSASTGREHLRVTGTRVDLCGAGHVARTLRRLLAYNEGEDLGGCRLFGIGNWSANDQDYISRLISASDEDCNWRDTAPFSIVPENSTEQDEITLIPISSRGSTTRVTRVYRETDGRLSLLRRIDEKSQAEVAMDDDLALPLLSPDDDVVVVVYDLDKGVISPELISRLLREYEAAEWWVRTKKVEAPSWLDEIRDRTVLRFLGPEVAANERPLGNWIYPIEGEPTLGRGGWRFLEDCGSLNTVAISDQGEVVAKDSENQHWTAVPRDGALGEIQVGWSSSLFAALVSQSGIETDPTNTEALRKALSDASDVCNARIGIPGIVPKHGEPKTASWTHQERIWTDTLGGFGLIGEKGSYELQLGRGSSDLDGYIAIMKEKRTKIRQIAKRFSSFERLQQSRPLSVLLLADPGAGKSALASALAEKFDLQRASADISQMLVREEVLDLFDRVRSMQQDRTKPVLVFVDEINSAPWGAGTAAYSSFLTVMDGGRYLRRGLWSQLDPCIWMFAGTEVDETEPKLKGKDFLARVNYTASITNEKLTRNGTDKDAILDSRLEQLYLGATLIKSLYPDVRRVKLSVLAQFFALEPTDSPSRKIRQEVHRLASFRSDGIEEENWRGEEWVTERKFKKRKLLHPDGWDDWVVLKPDQRRIDRL